MDAAGGAGHRQTPVNTVNSSEGGSGLPAVQAPGAHHPAGRGADRTFAQTRQCGVGVAAQQLQNREWVMSTGVTHQPRQQASTIPFRQRARATNHPENGGETGVG